MSLNPNGIDILEKNIGNIDWLYLSANPNIFELDIIKYNKDISDMANILDSIIC